MKLMGRWVRPALTALLATALIGESAAADSAAAESANYHHVYTNPETKEAFFNVYLPESKSSLKQRVISRTEDGTWYVLPEQLLELSSDATTPYLTAFTHGLTPPSFAKVYLDTAADELVSKMEYQNSPSGKFGVRVVIHYELPDEQQGYSKRVALFQKNNQNGVIRQIADSSAWPVIYWMPDGSLLMERYSETAKQNEIIRINPDTLETNRILLASLLVYDKQRGQILFTYNEPSREQHIYDIRTGKKRTATDQEVNDFYNRIPSVDRTEPPKVPNDLDIDSLPVKKLGYHQVGEADLTVNGKDISLPFVFFALDQKLYVPLRPIAESQGWKVDRQEGRDKMYRYALSTEQGQVKLDHSNSKILDDRLYVALGAIQKSADMAIRWIPSMP